MNSSRKKNLIPVIVFLIIGMVGFLLGISILYNSNFIYLYNFSEVYHYGHRVLNYSLEDPTFKFGAVRSLIWSEAEISVAWVYLILTLVYFPVGIGYLLIKKWGWYIGLIGGVISMIISLILFFHQFPELFFGLHYLVSGFLFIIGGLMVFHLALAKQKEERQKEGWDPALILIVVVLFLFFCILILILAATILGVNLTTSMIIG